MPRICWHTIFICGKPPRYRKPLKQLGLLSRHADAAARGELVANQIKRERGLSYEAAWFLMQRIRFAMSVDPLESLLGQDGGIVEIDETFVGGKADNNLHRTKTAAAGQKTIMMTLGCRCCCS